MSTALDRRETLADLLRRLGDIPPDRIRVRPPPGKASERDVLRIHRTEGRLYELVEGVLVEKAMGFSESGLGLLVAHFILNFLEGHDLGYLAGADGILRLAPGLVRIPDVCFVTWQRLGGKRPPEEPIPDLVPDLAVEVLSKSNTRREMERKLAEYFAVGVRLVWLIDPKLRTVEVYTSSDDCIVLRDKDTLDGGDVLPGFRLPLRKLFDRASKRSRGKNNPR